ncbi:MAG TPA: helix-turn-helix domain-containing protein [Solirubrobacterales bacterium]|nr:helix-turn-helix domain-containing protein [Solirubrobacterales bacterium]
MSNDTTADALLAVVTERVADKIADRVADHLAACEPPTLPTPGPLAVGITDAAELLGVSADHFRRHVLGELRIVRSGRLRLVPVSELEAWLDRSASRVLAGARLAHDEKSPHSRAVSGGAQGSSPGAQGRMAA